MISKLFSRVLTLVFVCALFTAVTSKPARLGSPERRVTNVAGTGTQTLKQFDARALHSTHTRPKRQTSAIAAERVAPGPVVVESNNEDATAAPAPASVVHISVVAKPKPTGLSRRQDVPGAIEVDALPVLPVDVPTELPVAQSAADEAEVPALLDSVNEENAEETNSLDALIREPAIIF